jgi:glycosyltransferase involved in cell wall biosynthesis
VGRVAIVSPNPSSRAGGVERVCTQLGDVLARHGWDVQIVGPTRAPTRRQFRIGLDYPSTSWSATSATRIRPWFDLVITNGFLGAGCPRQVPRIHLYHGTMIGNTMAQRGTLPIREQVRRTLSAGVTEALAGLNATRIVCVSELVANEVHRYYRLHPDATIPNGIDTSVFAPRDRYEARRRLGLRPDSRYALFVGRVEHGKGSDLLLEGTRLGGFELLIAGPTGVSDARHLGVLEPAALADAYAASDCVILPSRYEGCSLVVLEALACGRPLLTTRVGWMGTLLRAVPEYAALCIEPNVASLAGRLRLLPDTAIHDLSSDARAFVLRQNSLQHWSGSWLKLIDELKPSVASGERIKQTPSRGR